MRHPAASCLSHPKGRILNHRPENALDLDRVFEVALETGVALEVNGLPDRLDLSGAHVREAVAAGVPIVCSTDAHSGCGASATWLSVATASRGGAARAAVLNTPRSTSSTPLTGAGAALGVLVHLVPVRAAQRLGHLRVRVPGVEDVVLEVAADRDVAERDV